MSIWLMEPQIMDMVPLKFKLKKNTDVSTVLVYLVNHNVLLVLPLLTIVILVLLEELTSQIVSVHQVNILMLTTFVKNVIQNV